MHSNDFSFSNRDNDIDPDGIEAIEQIAVMYYKINRSAMRRWLHQADAFIMKHINAGWTPEELSLYGLIRDKLEHLYGLTPEESTAAMTQFPITDTLFWTRAKTHPVDETVAYVFEIYSGVREKEYMATPFGVNDIQKNNPWNVYTNLNCNQDCCSCDYQDFPPRGYKPVDEFPLDQIRENSEEESEDEEDEDDDDNCGGDYYFDEEYTGEYTGGPLILKGDGRIISYLEIGEKKKN